MAGHTEHRSPIASGGSALAVACRRRGLEGPLKRLLDIGLGGFLLLMLLPCMLVIALAVKIDSRGPVIFIQRRYGLNGEQFAILKFRTMYHHVHDLFGAQQSSARVTRVGRLLRKTGLDGLPQLWIVVRGQMSLVGPRPHPIGMIVEGNLAPELVPHYFARYDVKPGITGLAQVNGFGGPLQTSHQLRMRVRYDWYYALHGSLWMDLGILAVTCAQVVHGFATRAAVVLRRRLSGASQTFARRSVVG